MKALISIIVMGLFVQIARADDFVIPEFVNETLIDVDDVGSENIAIITELSVAKLSWASGADNYSQRTSLDFLYSDYLLDEMKFTFSNRFDYSNLSNGASNTSNALRELYLSYAPIENLELEVGRVNKKFGEALGYNPTDYLKKNALKLETSLLPSDLRKNRLGSVLASANINWENGALQLLYSPKITLKESTGNFSTDISKTNFEDRSLLSVQHKITDGFSPELLILKEGNDWNAGLNASTLIGNVATLYLEFNYTDADTYIDDMLGNIGESTWNTQFTFGTSVTVNRFLTLVGEYQYDGLAGGDYEALLASDLDKFYKYRGLVASKRGLLYKKNVFLSANISNLVIDRLSFTALYRADDSFESHQIYTGIRYYFEQIDSEISVFYRQDSTSKINLLLDRKDVQINFNTYW